MLRKLSGALLAAGLVVLAAPAVAGPWPRGAHEGFASATWRGTPEGRGDYAALYLEYGATERLTFGLDAGRAIDGSGKSVIFLQWAQRRRVAGLHLSWQLGLGRVDERAVVRPGVSLGRSFGEGHRTGWVAADALAEIGGDATTDLKLDVTLGVTRGGGRKALLQLQTGREWGDPPFARIEAVAVMPLRGRSALTLGVFHDLDPDGTGGIALGLWQRF